MIFCVEDDSSIRELMLYALQSAGFEGKGFPHGEALFQGLGAQVPDLILLRLGNNDARYCDGWDREEEERTQALKEERYGQFEEKYIAFLKEVREYNPQARILVFWDRDAAVAERVQKAVAAMQERYGDGKVCGMEIVPKQIESEGVGANGHWSVCTHRRVASQLIARVEEWMGWN